MEYSPMNKNDIRPECVVGIGASAGGLEALRQMLTFLPGNTGMAFVIIQHLAPDHKSLLSEILSKYTTMPVIEAEEGMKVKRNHVYMIPPKYNLEINADVLHLHEYDHTKINHPVDIFFRSLAKSYENRAVAVILSGTGSDGTNGIRSIKERNGVIIVQSPESAKFDGMPRNAISTGFVDLIQSPDSIAREMTHIASSMMNTGRQIQATDDDLMMQVFSILKKQTNINYKYYKKTTILRRIERRMVVTHNRNLQEYVTYLNNNPDEAKILAKEVLIGVTNFFRDPDYFEVLKERVIKVLLKETPRSQQIRVWVAGCSTGEEAYSIAILFTEAMEEMNIRREIKIFATDLDANAIGVAGRGVYGDNIIEDVSVTRLSRYFIRHGNSYTIRQDIRKMIVFAQHNVFQDPPFGKLDLISCRNLLIYFQTILQRNLFSVFHVALKDKRYLFLGRSESVIDYDDVFQTLCANEKIFIHNAAGKIPAHDKIDYSMQMMDMVSEPEYIKEERESEAQARQGEVDNRILEELMPASLLINDKNELIRSYGDCTELLSIPRGDMTSDIFSLLRTDLKIAVSTILKEAREKGSKIVYDHVPVRFSTGPEYVSVIAQPIDDPAGAETDYMVVTFSRERRKIDGEIHEFNADAAAAKRISNLENELKVSQENLQQTVTELESVNAELQAANEELLTANEELQSSNEELQSVNEELYTVNSEYQSKVSELAGVNDDMANFLSTTLVGILMVDKNLNIRKFTEYVAKEFNVAEQDVGRSLRYISYNFATIDLIDLCHQVLRQMAPIEKHCASIAGKTYLIRIAPYITTENNHEYENAEEEKKNEPHEKSLQGLVLTLMDTTKQVDDQEQIEEMAKALRQAVKSGREKETFLSHMSHDMRTPMTAIIGLAQLSLKQKNLTPEIKENLDRILMSSHYLMNLIDEILETSRIDAGKAVSVVDTVREETVLKEVESIIRERTDEAKQTFTSKILGSQGRYVLMDTEHVERILMNLLSNAVKFTPEGGSISLDAFVEYTDTNSVHTYVVRDNGRGMSKAFQNRMFQPFEQEENDPGTRKGTGLGLYICKNLVEMLGGSITCNSEPGKGTEFRVKLSFALATNEQIELSRKNMKTFQDRILYGKNILVTEDNLINAEVIMKMLEEKGVHTELAENGKEALEKIRQQPAYTYQAVLMDVMMPVMDGITATKEIRKLDQEDATILPIIALTADVQEETIDDCIKAGMTGYLTKPVDPDRLYEILAQEMEEAENPKKAD